MSMTHARELAVLSILAAHPAHGYEMAAALETGPVQLLGLKKSALYAILARFVKRGWIEERPEPGGSYPDRLVCHITDAGRAALPELTHGAGGLSNMPLLVLTMLHDMGQDVRDALRSEVALRKTLLDEFDADTAHADSATARLTHAVLQAELRELRRMLRERP